MRSRRDDAPQAIVDIGSNSVRLVVYERQGRAPLPRFNEKSLCRLGEGLAETGAIHPDNFRRTVEAVRRFRAIADAMGVGRIDATATEAMRRATNGEALQRAITAEAGLDHPHPLGRRRGPARGARRRFGVSFAPRASSGTWAEAASSSPRRSATMSASAGYRCRSAPSRVEALLAEGPDAAKRAVDARLAESTTPDLARSVFYAVGGGWRALAKAHMAAVQAPVPVVHGYTVDSAAIRAFAKSLWRPGGGKAGAALASVPARRTRTLPAAALVLDRTLKRLAPETVVFSALGLREGWALCAAVRRRAPARSADCWRGAHGPARRPRAAFCLGTRALDRQPLSGRSRHRAAGKDSRLRPVRYWLARSSRASGRRRCSAGCCNRR